MTSARSTFLALVLVGLPIAAPAAPVLHGGGSGDDALARAQAVTGRGDLKLHGDLAALGLGDDDALVASGAASLGFCAEPPGGGLEKLLVAVRIRIDDMEYGQAMAALAEAADRLPCGAAGASADQLYDLFFLHGLSAFNEGHESTARKRFAQAAVMAPSRKWDERYPPTAKPLYLEALQEALAGRQVPLEVAVDGLTVDGEAVPANQPVTLLAGGHLVALGAQTAWLELPPVGSVTLASAGVVRAGLAGGDSRFAPWVEALGSDAVLVTDDAVFELRSGVLVARSTASESAPVAAPLLPVGAVLAGSGGALLALGLGLNREAFLQGQPAPEDGLVHVNRQHYDELFAQNRAGLGLAIAGGALTAAGVAVVVVSQLRSGGGLAWAPWVVAQPGAVAFGLGGVLP